MNNGSQVARKDTRLTWVIILCLSALSLASDIKLRLWTDEIFTLLTSRQTSVPELIQAVKAGTEGPPPLYDCIVHFLLPVIRNDALAARLPSTIGIYAMVLGVFLFCRRRVGTLYGLVAAMLALNACLYYATDGRPYGAVMGCAAWALVCWQRVDDSRHRLLNLCGLSVCLSLMVAFHYFAVFLFGPIVLVEIISFYRERKVDVGVFVAVGIACLALLAHYPLLVAGSADSKNFWSQASISMIRPFYENFWLPMLGICAIGILLPSFFRRFHPSSSEHAVPLREWVLLISITVVPAIAIVVTKYTIHAFVDRYMLWSVIGMAALTVFPSTATYLEIVVSQR